MAIRTPQTLHAAAVESGTSWTSPRIRGGDVDALIAVLRTLGVVANVNIQLYGVDQLTNASYLIDQSPNFPSTGSATSYAFNYGPGASQGFYRSVACYIPYEYFFIIGYDSSPNFTLSLETIT